MPSYRERGAHVMGRLQRPVTATPTLTAAGHACCPMPCEDAGRTLHGRTVTRERTHGPCKDTAWRTGQDRVAGSTAAEQPGRATLPHPGPTSEASLRTPTPLTGTSRQAER